MLGKQLLIYHLRGCLGVKRNKFIRNLNKNLVLNNGNCLLIVIGNIKAGYGLGAKLISNYVKVCGSTSCLLHCFFFILCFVICYHFVLEKKCK